MVEPWLRGTLTEVDAVRRQVLHALDLAREDVERWSAGLSDAEMDARPFGVASVAFHLRHIARSLDRLMTYAEGRTLSPEQMEDLRSEMESGAVAAAVMEEVRAGLRDAAGRVRAIAAGSYEEARGVGRAMLPSTVGGLLVHCAEHTQRHVGQAVTTAKVVMGMRQPIVCPMTWTRVKRILFGTDKQKELEVAEELDGGAAVYWRGEDHAGGG